MLIMNIKAMRKIPVFPGLVVLIACLCLAQACKKKNEETSASGTGNVPVVQTVGFNKVLLNTVDFNGNVTDDGGSFVTVRGFCYSSTVQNPTILDSRVENGIGAGTFTVTLTGMKGQTMYHVRAFATNSNGTGYGSSFAVQTIDSILFDVNGRSYPVIQIGSQVWMGSNLKVWKFNDGKVIQSYGNPFVWDTLVIPAMTWYNDNGYMDTTWGCLYNWYAVNTGKLAPAGWHVPTDSEWTTLVDYLGGNEVAGGLMKSTGIMGTGNGLWASPNLGATNSSRFGGLPAGDRGHEGNYYDLNQFGSFWTSTEKDVSYAWYRMLSYNNAAARRTYDNKTFGFSVRCIRD